MSKTVRITKSSLKASKTCHDGLLLGLKEPRELCRGCRTYFDLPVKKKPQSELGVRLYRCLLIQEDGFPLLSIANTNTSSERKRKQDVYCQVISTPAQTPRRALPFASSSELSNTSCGRPSMKATVDATRKCYSSQVAYYKDTAREKDEENLHLQDELERTREELARVNERCNILENDVVRLESCRRRTNRLKKMKPLLTAAMTLT